MSTRTYARHMLFKAMIFFGLVIVWQFQCEQYKQLLQYSSEKEGVPLGSIYTIHKQVPLEPSKDTREGKYE